MIGDSRFEPEAAGDGAESGDVEMEGTVGLDVHEGTS